MNETSTLAWRKSSYSGGAGSDGACVEVASLEESVVGVRDSKSITIPSLSLSPAAFSAFAQVAARS